MVMHAIGGENNYKYHLHSKYVPSFTRVQQYSRYTLLLNRVFVPDLIFHSNQIFLLLVLMRAFVPGGKDRLPTHPVRPYLYRVAASQADQWRTAS
jgi:hypothetical protein